MSSASSAGIPAESWPARIARFLRRLAGRTGPPVTAVFASDPASCHRSVLHLSQGAADVPVWLFATCEPWHRTAALCDRVVVVPGPLALMLAAERQLSRRWVALRVAAWTGERRALLLKLAPFLSPPFRVLLLNEHGDFFAGAPLPILAHVRRRFRDRLHSSASSVRDRLRGLWLLLSYHVWRSGPVRRAKDEIGGRLLLVASWLLRLTGHPHRWIFRRLTAASPAHAAALAPADSALDPRVLADCVAHFRQPGEVWNGDAFEAFARSTDARWILWLAHADAPTAVESLRPLLEDPAAFAAAPQIHRRAWKPSLFATAPFRTLQPDEATAVLAPLSHAILVDRARLLALGIPRCGLPAVAWMLLFWKAAAAGWRSYAVGRTLPVAEQPDHPVQETAVFLEVACNPGLRRLAPRQPDLLRGNIAFAPALQRHSRHSGDRPKVLLVSPFLPYPLSHGGAVRIFNLCRALAGRVDFILAAMRESHEAVDYARLHEVFRQVAIVDRDEPSARDSDLPAQVRQYRSPSLSAWIAEMAHRWQPDVLQIEFTHMAGFRDAAPEIPAILVEHDLTYSLYRQLAERQSETPRGRRAAEAEYQRWLAFERRWLNRFDAVWTVSPDDRRAAIAAGSRDPALTCTIPNGVDLDRFRPSPDPDGAAPEILYVGAFRHLPNLLGFERLRTVILPLVWRRCPEARLRVVAGPQHERFWKQFGAPSHAAPLDPRIEIHGFVEDLRPLYARASAVAVPLEVSAGTNIKVMEAMACGRALVTTPLGCAGLALEDGHDALIRADADAFAEALADLLSRPALRQAIAARARRTVELRFGWTSIADAAFRSYTSLARKTPLSAAAAN